MRNLSIYLTLLGVMIIWGLNVSAIKILVESFPTILIQAVRVFMAGIVVFIALGVMKKLRKPNKKEYVYIVFGGLLNVTAHHLFLGLGLSNTSAVNGGLILGMGPLLTALMAILFIGTRLTMVRSIGFISGGIGIAFIVLGGGEGLSGISLGDLYVFLSILAQAASFILISKAAKTMDPRLLTGYMLIFGSVVLIMVGSVLEPEGIINGLMNATLVQWLILLGSAVFATALGHMVYNHAVGKVGPAETSIFLNLNTFFSLLGAALFLGEKVTSFHLYGLIFIIIGVLFGSGALEEIQLRRRSAKNVA
ncbi:DMT family transporter [Mesobacillus maritimus]|uniref:DMT family transporter n=1 Tax=Mesobacillus maritimus TaxID=1643336 RepID=UPI00203F328A|nr:DMT family transporter [Mesobacillus maritimus]MCM3585669.1 DMT family transporter [Mesobacillus maritimus]